MPPVLVTCPKCGRKNSEYAYDCGGCGYSARRENERSFLCRTCRTRIAVSRSTETYGGTHLTGVGTIVRTGETVYTANSWFVTVPIPCPNCKDPHPRHRPMDSFVLFLLFLSFVITCYHFTMEDARLGGDITGFGVLAGCFVGTLVAGVLTLPMFLIRNLIRMPIEALEVRAKKAEDARSRRETKEPLEGTRFGGAGGAKTRVARGADEVSQSQRPPRRPFPLLRTACAAVLVIAVFSATSRVHPGQQNPIITTFHRMIVTTFHRINRIFGGIDGRHIGKAPAVRAAGPVVARLPGFLWGTSQLYRVGGAIPSSISRREIAFT
jgi:hypothetical protein